MRIQLTHTFDDIVSLDNLLAAWQEFGRGKRQKFDVQKFGFRLIDNLVSLHEDLVTQKYRHGGYHAFSISDPKPRRIHKASVRDRVLHHAIYRLFYPFFDRTFCEASFSCRIGRGTHRALKRFNDLARRVSRNQTCTCWVLKMDITKFFANIDQDILLGILSLSISDRRVLWLLEQVIRSFDSGKPGIGLPLGNLTSQLLVNVYMNEFDQYVKHGLKVKNYIRYADDFVVFSTNRDYLKDLIEPMAMFLRDGLCLTLHPNKISLATVASGVDFLGWVHFPHHRVLRTSTKRRMLVRIREHATDETVQSYLGLLGQGNTFKLKQSVLNGG